MSDARTPEILPCPFCGETPDENSLKTDESGKWGRVSCCCEGPETRTGYDGPDAWKADAIMEWNRRATPQPAGVPHDVVRALEEWAAQNVTRSESIIAGIGPVSANTPEDAEAGRIPAYQLGYQVGYRNAVTDAVAVATHQVLDALAAPQHTESN